MIANYEQHLLRSPALMAQVALLHGKALQFFCAPAPCHGDVLEHYAAAIATTGEMPEHSAFAVIYPRCVVCTRRRPPLACLLTGGEGLFFDSAGASCESAR